MKPRILIFTSTYFPYVGGAEVAIKEITSRLAAEYNFDLVCARYDFSLPFVEQVGAVRVYRIGFGIRVLDKILIPFASALWAAAQSARVRYSAYWAVMVTYGSGGAYIANMVRFWAPVPIILTLQEGDPPEYIRTKWFGVLGLSWRLALARSAVVTVISSYLGDVARSFGYTGETLLVPNGVAVRMFARMRARSIDTHCVRLITTSRLVNKNAIDDIIRALVFLPTSVTLSVYGVGQDEVPLKALAGSLKLETRVHFCGHCTHQELPDVLAEHDIFIRPSRSEGMGNSFIEAMAAGLPVIATQEGGIADFLFDAQRNPDKNTTGWAVDKDNPKQIAEAVKNIIANPDQVKKVTETAKRMVEQQYDWDLIAHAMQEKVFDPVLKKHI